MKKLLLNFWRFFNLIFLEIVLSVVAFISWNMVNELGSKIYSPSAYDLARAKSAINVTSGFEGGALAMG